MCVTDRHDMTLAVEVALYPNTTNQLTVELTIYWHAILLEHDKTEQA